MPRDNNTYLLGIEAIGSNYCISRIFTIHLYVKVFKKFILILHDKKICVKYVFPESIKGMIVYYKLFNIEVIILITMQNVPSIELTGLHMQVIKQFSFFPRSLQSYPLA